MTNEHSPIAARVAVAPAPSPRAVSLSTRVEQMFPTLTPAQIERIAARGRRRTVRPGEVLLEPNEQTAHFFAVATGQIEVVRDRCGEEELVAVLPPGQFTGEINMLSGRRGFVRVRVSAPGEVIELDHDHLLGIVQTDSELSEILMRAFILRRVELDRPGSR